MSLKHMEIALRVKMLWQALHSKTLWADFFRGKYIKGAHLSDVSFNKMHGVAKRSWDKAKQIILKHHRTVIRDGSNTNFWLDKWLGDFTLADMASTSNIMNPNATVKEILLQTNPKKCSTCGGEFVLQMPLLQCTQ